MTLTDLQKLKAEKYQIESTLEDLNSNKQCAFWYTDTRKQWDKDIKAAKKQLAKINCSIKKLATN